MMLAAIDIGSNAVRLLIKDTEAGQSTGNDLANQINQPDFLNNLDDIGHTDYYERQPLKSGMDVFDGGTIKPATALKLTAIIARFGAKMKEMGVSHYRACATSAYRDATNGRDVIRQISEATGVEIEVISGDEEARLTRMSLILPPRWAKDIAVISDVGGGSTELSVLLNGGTLFSHSFKIGSMRYLCHRQDPLEERLIDAECAKIRQEYGAIHYFGVGGCIKFMCSYINGTTKRESQPASQQKPVAPSRTVEVSRMEEIYADLKTRSVESIVSHYHLPRERAEILTPACSIYLRIAHSLGAGTIIVPSIGVRNGIITQLFRRFAK